MIRGHLLSRPWFSVAPARILAGFLAVCLLAGCEDEISPFNTTDFPFTIWGIINPKADTQAVRIFTIEATLDLIPSESIDAMASIIDVSNDVRHVLQDSVTQLPGGDYRHTFWSEFNVEHGNLYRVEVERSDGMITRSSEIRVPEPVTLIAPIPTELQISELKLPVEIEGNPPSLPRIDVIYNAYASNNFGARLTENPIAVSYSGAPDERNGALSLNLDMREDFIRIRSIFNSQDLEGEICLDDIIVQIHVGNEEWRSPTGVFDPNVLVEPGTLSNVDNGFGFFGAGFVETISLIPPATMQVRAGFFDCVSVTG